MKTTRRQRREERSYEQWRAQALDCPLHLLPELQWRAFGGRKRNRPAPIKRRTLQIVQEMLWEMEEQLPFLHLFQSAEDAFAQRWMILDLAREISQEGGKQR